MEYDRKNVIKDDIYLEHKNKITDDNEQPVIYFVDL